MGYKGQDNTNDFIEPEKKEGASTPTVQPSQEAQANVSAPAPTPPPVPTKPAKRQYNPAKLTIQIDIHACRWMSDYDKRINLVSAGRRDLASRLDCVEIPAGEHVIFLDEVSSMRQIHWEHNGAEFQGWLLEDYALDNLESVQELKFRSIVAPCRHFWATSVPVKKLKSLYFSMFVVNRRIGFGPSDLRNVNSWTDT